MSRTYRARGINLKSIPMGESDRLATILSPEHGLIRAVAPGARKPKSSLRGRLEPFVVNDLLIVQGRSLHRIIQADTCTSFPALGRDLAKLAIAQYWAELVLAMGESDHGHETLYALLLQHLAQLAALDPQARLAGPVAQLVQGMVHLLQWGGMAPQWDHCCLTGAALAPPLDQPSWRVGVSFELGGLVALPQPSHLEPVRLNAYLGGAETYLLQQLSHNATDLVEPPQLGGAIAWRSLERVLRHYSQYHLGQGIRSATLLDTLFIEEF